MIKRLFLPLAAAVLLLIVGVAGVSAHGEGNSPAHLTEAGWSCENVPGLGVHCFAPGTVFGRPTVQVKVFDTADPTAEHAPYLGTELLIRDDLYAGQPCPQEGLDEWFLLPFGYRACHHYSH